MTGKEWRGRLRQLDFIRCLEAEGIIGWCSAFFLFWSPSPGIEQPTFRAGLPTSVKALWKHPHSHVCSHVTPNPVN